ncbi:hypothetical protein CR513_20611, partial [Mucuna pruriens]
MLDLGASINVMPTSIYKALNFGDLEPTRMTIQLANRSIVQPLGILEDILVQVNELIFPADFYVLDMEDEKFGKESTLILGRPFLMIARTKIDVHVGTLSMEFRDTLEQAQPYEHKSRLTHLLPEFQGLRLKSKITKLTSLVRQLAIGQHHSSPLVRVCGMCAFVEHATNACPTLST